MQRAGPHWWRYDIGDIGHLRQSGYEGSPGRLNPEGGWNSRKYDTREGNRP